MLKLSVSEDLVLQNFREEDVEELFSVIQSNAAHLQAWIPWIDARFNSWEHMRTFVQEQHNAMKEQEGLMLGIYKREQLIGMAGLQHWDHDVSMAELGFWLSKDFLKQGIMKQTLGRLLRFGFGEMALLRVTAAFPINNIQAHKCLERLDFKVEGVLRKHIVHHGLRTDMVLMGLLREEWVHQSTL